MKLKRMMVNMTWRRTPALIAVVSLFIACMFMIGSASNPNDPAGTSGSVTASEAFVEAHHVQGNLLSEPPQMTDEQLLMMQQCIDNRNLPTFPTPVEQPIPPMYAPTAPESEIDFSDHTTNANAPAAPGDFRVYRNQDLGGGAPSGYTSVVGEPAVGNTGECVFMSGNWYASLSTDGGINWSFINPYTTFPASYGGFCCDQDVIYDPSRDIMIWLLMYLDNGTENAYRIAVASGCSDLQSASWCYYDFTPSSFGLPTGTFLDYPHIALTDNTLYFTSNVFYIAGSFHSTLIARIPLDPLATCSGFGFGYYDYADRSTFTLAQGGHGTCYWATHNSTSSIRVYRWDEGSGSIYWDDVAHTAYTSTPRNSAHCDCGDGDACQRFDDRVMCGWVANGVIGFGWCVAEGNGFTYPYSRFVRLNEADRTLLDEPIVFSGSYAWMYPSAGVNARGHVGGTIFAAGSGNCPIGLAWIADDYNSSVMAPLENAFLVQSTNGPSSDKWGDYLRCRPHDPCANTWIGTVFSLQGGTTDSYSRPRYVWFGRERDETCITCAVNPTTLDFGEVCVGEYQDQSFTITNVGSGTMTGTVSESCSHFSIISGGGAYSLTAGQSVTVVVRFQPTSSGYKTCSIATGTYCSNVSCAGTGAAPVCSVTPTSLAFGTVCTGEYLDKTFTIENTGGCVLSGSVSESCAYYSIVSGGGSYSLTTGQTRTVTVRYAPTTTGSHNCTIETGAAICSDVSCTGNGYELSAPTLACTPGQGYIELNWNSVAGATEYCIYRDDVQVACGITETAWADNDVCPPVEHCYEVTSYSATCGESAKSNRSCCTAMCGCELTCFTFTGNTGESYSIVIDVATWEGLPLQIGDEIAVYDGDLCVGASCWDGNWPLALVAWADDSQTGEVDGYICGHDMSFRIARPSECSHCYAEYANFSAGNGTFCNGPFSQISSMNFVCCTEYAFNLTTGWNFISLNVDCAMSPIDLLDPVISEVNIVKQSDGLFCIPGVICQIPVIDCQQGYKIHMKSSQSFAICCQLCNYNTPIPVDPGWNWIAFLPPCCIAAPEAMASIESCLNIVKDGSGNFYIPGVINSLGDMCPGQGYAAHMDCQDEVVYPACTPGAAARTTSGGDGIRTVANHFFIGKTSDNYQAVIVNVGDGLSIGDEIGLFTESGLLVGSGVYEGSSVAIAAWSDDPQTDEVDGYVNGDEMVVKVWNAGSDTEKRVEPELLEGSFEFGAAPYTVLNIAPEKIATSTADFKLSANYPNPFNPETMIDYTLPAAGHVTLSIYNLLGQKVRTLVDDYREAGSHSVTWDGTSDYGERVSSGVYLYRLDTSFGVDTKKMMLLK